MEHDMYDILPTSATLALQLDIDIKILEYYSYVIHFNIL